MPPLLLPLGIGSGPTGKQLEARSLREAICKGETQVLQGLEPEKKKKERTTGMNHLRELSLGERHRNPR